MSLQNKEKRQKQKGQKTFSKFVSPQFSFFTHSKEDVRNIKHDD